MAMLSRPVGILVLYRVWEIGTPRTAGLWTRRLGTAEWRQASATLRNRSSRDSWSVCSALLLLLRTAAAACSLLPPALGSGRGSRCHEEPLGMQAAATRLVLTVGALAQAARATAGCGSNNGGCVPGTLCSVGVGGRIDCDYSHTCPALLSPTNGFVQCPGSTPGAQPTYSLRLVEGNLARSVEHRTQCMVGCNAGFSAQGFTSPRYCTATGWSDTSAVRCMSSPQCSPTNNPCQHGGRCTATVNGGYRCACTAGWAGRDCQQADSVR
jgi:hypothetical protein